MVLADLQLEHSALTELSVHVDPNPVQRGQGSDNEVTLEATPEYGRSEERPDLWQVWLAVKFTAPGLYEGTIGLKGVFRAKAELLEDKLLLLVAVNAPAMLYSSAREIVAGLTARCANGQLILPSINFTDVSLTRPEEGEAVEPNPKAPRRSGNKGERVPATDKPEKSK